MTIATYFSDEDFYKAPAHIERVRLFEKRLRSSRKRATNKKRRSIPSALKRKAKEIISLRQKILKLKPDLVIAFEAGKGSLIATALVNSNTPLIVSERNNPDSKVKPRRTLAKKMRPLIYHRGVVCSVQTDGFAKWCEENWRIKPIVTPNQLMPDELVNWEEVSKRRANNNFIALGRYVPQKGFADLLRAWQIVEREDEELELDLYGFEDGEYLRKLAVELGLKRARINSATNNVRSVLDSSRCLISPSYYEGFPNVVLEALGRGTPVIATPSSDAIHMMAENGAIRVVPVGDPDSLARAIIAEKSSDFSERSRLAWEAGSQFSWENVAPSWEAAIEAASKTRGFQMIRFR